MIQHSIEFPPFQEHSGSSFDAAAAIKPSAATLRDKVLRFIEERGDYGATDDEIQVSLNMNPSTERPRRIELMELGLVTRATINRKTRTGRSAAVWIAA